MSADAVDTFIGQWATQRPALNLGPMALIGRLHRAGRLASAQVRAHFNTQGIEDWEFDVLATLRRSGPPYTLTPKQLAASTMVGSSALTNRVDRLVQRKLVTREVDPTNRRSLLITLSPDGLELVDRVVEGHLATERQLLAGLEPDEQQQLNDLLRKLLLSLGDILDTA
jgi:DNA-binding MarR family transcriptional regulator